MHRFPSRCVLMTVVVMAMGTHCQSQELENRSLRHVAGTAVNAPPLDQEAPLLPFEDDAAIQVVDQHDIRVHPANANHFATHSAGGSEQAGNCQSCEAAVLTDPALFPPVKNVNFFGIDRHSCCDEWAGLCDCKNVSFNCQCGQVKPRGRDSTMGWLKNKLFPKQVSGGGESCGCAGSGCGNQRTAGQADCGCQQDSRDTTSASDTGRSQSIFGRPFNNSGYHNSGQ